MSNGVKVNLGPHQSFGQLLYEARTATGKNVRDVALAVKKQQGPDVSITLISLIENGRSPTLDVAYALAKTLNLNIERALAAAYYSRITYSIEREKAAIEAFTRRNRLGKKMDLRRIIAAIDIGQPDGNV